MARALSSLVDHLGALDASATVLGVGVQTDETDELARHGVAVTRIDPAALVASSAQERVDLVLCVGVLDTVTPEAAHDLVDAICRVTDRVLVGAATRDASTVSRWAPAFARRGLFRSEARGGTASAVVVLERRDASAAELVEQYEAMLARDSGRAREVDLADRSVQDRHAELVARDHVIGLEAAAAKLDLEVRMVRRRLRAQRARADEADAQLQAVRSSRTWRVGRLVTGPMRRLRG